MNNDDKVYIVIILLQGLDKTFHCISKFKAYFPLYLRLQIYAFPFKSRESYHEINL